MQTDSPSLPDVPSQPEALNPSQQTKAPLLAPAWHTAALIIILLTNSFLTALVLGKHPIDPAKPHSNISEYLGTIALQIFLVLFIWVGLRLKKFKMRDLIGGKWSSPESFLLDIGIALGFWFAALLILTGTAFALGLTGSDHLHEMQRRMGGLIPNTRTEMGLWLAVSMTAGFAEEIIFRGYLQRQIAALFGNVPVGVLISAVLFGLGHGYQGVKNMILISVFGSLFGMLALWRKSLRPGMMAHAWQDALAGLAYRMLTMKN